MRILRSIFITLFFIVLFIVFYLLTGGGNQKNSSFPTLPTPTPVPLQSQQQVLQKELQGIVPNSPESSIVNQLGTPQETQAVNDTTTLYSYVDSTNNGKQKSIYVQNSKVILIVNQNLQGNSLFLNYKTQFDPQKDVLMYDVRFLGGTYAWYIFPSDGIAFLADKNTGYTIQQQLFSPLSKNDYLTSFKQLLNLQTEPTLPDALNQ